MKKLTQQEFIERAKSIHGEWYGYSNVVYKNGCTKVCLICPIHGEFLQRPQEHLRGHGCPICGNNAVSNTEEFVKKAILIHGNKYDYSKVVYVRSKDKVCIICKECGREFYQTPNSHLRGNGCPYCATRHINDKTRGKSRNCIKKPKYGVGINDYGLSTRKLLSYIKWTNMLQRCYCEEWKAKHKTYAECTVCDEWKLFSNFKKWFDENYVEGYELDKDIIIKNNKIYSPDTCCFVPQEINSLLTRRANARGQYPIGVTKQKNSRRFLATLNTRNGRIHLGRFDTSQEAFYAYKTAKEKHIKDVAQEYFNKGLIAENVYQALLNYEIEITD